MSWGHALETTSPWTGAFPTKIQAIYDGRRKYGATKAFVVAEGQAPLVERFVPPAGELAELLVQEMWLRAFSILGDRGDALLDPAEIPVSAKEELHTFIRSWASRWIQPEWQPTTDPSYVGPLVSLQLIPNPDIKETTNG